MQISAASNHVPMEHAVRLHAVQEQPNFIQLLQAAESAASDSKSQGTGQPQQETASGISNAQSAESSDDLRKAFSDFVGQTFFSELIKSYRSTQQPAAYFNGGRAEKIFQGQLDQMFAEELSSRSADKIAEPMYEQFKRM